MSHGQAGICKNPAGRKTDAAVSRRKINLGFLHGFFRLSAEIVILRQSDVPFRSGFHFLNRLHTAPRLKGRVNQGHKAGEQLRRFFLFWGSSLLFLLAGIAGLLRTFRDSPRSTKPFRTGDTPLGAVLVDPALGHTPFFSRHPDRYITFHLTPPVWKSFVFGKCMTIFIIYDYS